MINVKIRLNEKSGFFEHYWEKCVGSGHASLALRSDWRKHLKRCRDSLGFRYVRFHGLLNDDMSVYKSSEGVSIYSFFNIDSIFDYLLDIGMKPFIELGFMPNDLASGNKTVFHYGGNITPPKNYKRWGSLIEKLVEHLIGRYGRKEVRSWFFEVWNEPDLKSFWSGTKSDYFKLYLYSVRAVKKIDSKIHVGGPATSGNKWIPDIIKFSRKNKLPLDFISTHQYPTDITLGRGLDMERSMAKALRDGMKNMAKKARKEAGKLPLYYTEWNNSPGSRDSYHDEPYAAAFAVKTIADNQGVADIYSFWTFSDIFEEEGFPSAPFHGGFGLLNLHGIPKPAFRAFELLHRLGNEKIATSTDKDSNVGAFATKKKGKYTLILYNHNIPKASIKEELVRVIIEKGKLPRFAEITRIDENHSNPKKEWARLGSPAYPDKGIIAKLKKSSELSASVLNCRISGGKSFLDIKIPPHGITAVTF
ncbi:MAG: beta-xylosidase [bacterium]|nr:beta-xylosidase [bacterium]